MLKRRRIAVLMATLLIGAPLGVAAVNEGLLASTSAEAEYAESTPAEVVDVAAAPAEGQSVDQVTMAGPMDSSEAPTVTYAKTDESVFPPSTDVRIRLPAEIAYLDQIEASRRAAGELIARGDVFPPSTDDRIRLPAEIAYLNSLQLPGPTAAASSATANPMLALGEMPPHSAFE
jgi:hypothetical protein